MGIAGMSSGAGVGMPENNAGGRTASISLAGVGMETRIPGEQGRRAEARKKSLARIGGLTH